MSYQETEVDGKKVKVWADAMDAGVNPSDPKVKTYIEVDGNTLDSEEQTRFEQANHRQMAALENAGAAKALEGVQGYVAANGPDALKDKIAAAPAELADSYAVERQAILDYRKSIMPTPQSTAAAAALTQ